MLSTFILACNSEGNKLSFPRVSLCVDSILALDLTPAEEDIIMDTLLFTILITRMSRSKVDLNHCKSDPKVEADFRKAVIQKVINRQKRNYISVLSGKDGLKWNDSGKWMQAYSGNEVLIAPSLFSECVIKLDDFCSKNKNSSASSILTAVRA